VTSENTIESTLDSKNEDLTNKSKKVISLVLEEWRNVNKDIILIDVDHGINK